MPMQSDFNISTFQEGMIDHVHCMLEMIYKQCKSAILH